MCASLCVCVRACDPVSTSRSVCLSGGSCCLEGCYFSFLSFDFTFDFRPGNWLKRSSLSGLTDGVEDLLDISSVDRLSFIRQSSKVSRRQGALSKRLETSRQGIWSSVPRSVQVKFTSAVKLSEGGAVGPEYSRDEEENFFKRLGKWRSGRRNPSKLHHTEEKDGSPPTTRGAPHHPSHAPFSCVSPPLCLYVCGGPHCLPAQFCAPGCASPPHHVRPSDCLVPRRCVIEEIVAAVVEKKLFPAFLREAFVEIKNEN